MKRGWKDCSHWMMWQSAMKRFLLDIAVIITMNAQHSWIPVQDLLTQKRHENNRGLVGIKGFKGDRVIKGNRSGLDLNVLHTTME